MNGELLYKFYIMSESTMNPFSKQCFCLIVNNYGTSILSVYIQTIFSQT